MSKDKLRILIKILAESHTLNKKLVKVGHVGITVEHFNIAAWKKLRPKGHDLDCYI